MRESSLALCDVSTYRISKVQYIPHAWIAWGVLHIMMNADSAHAWEISGVVVHAVHVVHDLYKPSTRPQSPWMGMRCGHLLSISSIDNYSGYLIPSPSQRAPFKCCSNSHRPWILPGSTAAKLIKPSISTPATGSYWYTRIFRAVATSRQSGRHQPCCDNAFALDAVSIFLPVTTPLLALLRSARQPSPGDWR